MEKCDSFMGVEFGVGFMILDVFFRPLRLLSIISHTKILKFFSIRISIFMKNSTIYPPKKEVVNCLKEKPILEYMYGQPLRRTVHTWTKLL